MLWQVAKTVYTLSCCLVGFGFSLMHLAQMFRPSTIIQDDLWITSSNKIFKKGYDFGGNKYMHCLKYILWNLKPKQGIITHYFLILYISTQMRSRSIMLIQYEQQCAIISHDYDKTKVVL